MIERLEIGAGYEGKLWFYHAHKARRFPSHRHAELELNLVTRGDASYVLADRRYELGIGSAVWLFPAQEHVIARRSDDMTMWIAVFRPRLVRAATAGAAELLRKRNPTGVLCRTLHAPDAARLTAIFTDLQANEPRHSTYNAGLSYLLLSSWDAFSRAEQLPDHAKVHPAVSAAAQLLTRGQADLSVEQIAETVALSPERLSRLFHAHMGVRLGDFRNRVRMTRFFSLYGEGNRIKMLAAALKAGFGSYPQFHRIFTQHTGMGPREYFRNPPPGAGAGLEGARGD